MEQILGLDHVSILVKDAEASRRFYQRLLGLSEVARPELGFPGYWLQLHGSQTLHIMELPNPNEQTVRPEHGGRDFHFALRVLSIEVYIEKLDAMNIRYSMSKSGRKALFVKDLDDNAFELVEVEV